jgi:hypothetical protein
MTNIDVFRPKSNFLLAGTLVLISVLTAAQFIFSGELHSSLVAIFGTTTATAVAWVAFVRPKVVISDEGIRIVNPLREFQFGWSEVDAIETKYALTVVAGKTKVRAWVAPAPSRYHARGVHSSEVKGLGSLIGGGTASASLRPGDSLRSDSGVAAHLARLRFSDYKPGTVSDLPRELRFNWAGTAALLIGLIGLILLQNIHF